MNIDNWIIDILSSDDPVGGIVGCADIFRFVGYKMVGVQHTRFHAEGDVWDHTKLCIKSLPKDHDWVDVLIALFHDAGKKDALDANGGKNMAGHEVYSLDIFENWLEETHFMRDELLENTVRWTIGNHMKVLNLDEMRSAYDVMDIVTDPWFPRLRTLATADCEATLGTDGKPTHPFSEILAHARVQRWLGKPRVEPIVNAADFLRAGVPTIGLAHQAVEAGLKIQINGNLKVRDHIINSVLHDRAFKQKIHSAQEYISN